MQSTLLALMLLSSPALPREPPRVDKIIGGAGVTSGRWPAVVAVAAGKEMCTGTMIAPDRVLTAAHCFRTTVQGEFAAIYFGEVIHTNVVEGARWETHPDFCGEPSCEDGTADFAYVRLPTSEERPHAYIRPLSAEDETSSALSFGAAVTVVGFGVLTPEAPGAGGGIKRELVTTLGSVSASEGTFVTDGTESGDTCLGDSGGPALVQIDGEWRIAGVLSRGSLPGAARPIAPRQAQAIGWKWQPSIERTTTTR